MEASTVQEVGGASHTQEWKGQAPSKFNGSRKHIPEPKLKEVPHPLYTIHKKRNFEQKLSATHEWKPSVRVNNAKDQSKPERPVGTKKVDINFTDMKPRAERKHLTEKASQSYEDAPVGKQTYIGHNRKTVKEFSQEQLIGNKKRVETLYDARNGVPLKSLGDKFYKAPQYEPGFYKDGGLIVGSSNVKRKAVGGNAKAIDFYAGLELGKGPLNPGMKTWKQAQKEEQLNDELDSVKSLNSWEKNVLKEADPKFQVIEDSDEEESVVKNN